MNALRIWARVVILPAFALSAPLSATTFDEFRKTVSATIHHGDLDLTLESDRLQLDLRVQAAARNICSHPGEPSDRRCIDEVHASRRKLVQLAVNLALGKGGASPSSQESIGGAAR